MSNKSHIHLLEIQMGGRHPQVEWQGNLRDTFDAVLDTANSHRRFHGLTQWSSSETALYCWSMSYGSKLWVKVGISANPPARMKNHLKSMPPGFAGLMLGFAYPELTRGGVEELETAMLAACMKYMVEVNSEWLQIPPRLLGDWSGYPEKGELELDKRFGLQRHSRNNHK